MEVHYSNALWNYLQYNIDSRLTVWANYYNNRFHFDLLLLFTVVYYFDCSLVINNCLYYTIIL